MSGCILINYLTPTRVRAQTTSSPDGRKTLARADIMLCSNRENDPVA